jgi:type II secretory pathway component GspD/PulD (secretin)
MIKVKSKKLEVKSKKAVALCFCLLVLSFSFLGPAQAAKGKPDLTLEKGKVYLNLKDADIKNVLQIFAKATGINIVAADDVTGKITVTFSGIVPKDGLEAVLRTKGLDWFEDHGTIFVSTKKIMRTYYLANAKPSDLQATLAAILPTGSIVTANDSYNVLVIQTSSDYLPRLEKLINELDVAPLQVLVEAQLIEVQLSEGSNLGIDSRYTYQNNVNDKAQNIGMAGRASDANAQGLYAQILSGNAEAFLSTLSNKSGINVIASPRLTTLNNKEATILIGSKFGYTTSVISQTSTTQVVNFLSVGTQLSITPNITKNGFIQMKVSPKISDGSVINNLPQENTTETHNEVMVKDGQTFVIGGLTKDKDVQTDYGIPFIMDIPLLGAFFRRTVITKQKDELLVFITPHILTPEYLGTLNQPIDEMKKKSADHKAHLVH